MTLLTQCLARQLRHDEADPLWPDRDRIIVSGQGWAELPDGAVITDGSPGLAVGAGTGLAIAERLLSARFGRSLVDHRTWVVARQADLTAGTAHEALGVASALSLGRLTVLAAMPHRDTRLAARYTAAGWSVRVIEAEDATAAGLALAAVARSQKPTLIIEAGRPGDAPSGPAQTGETTRSGPAARRAWLKRLRRHAQRDAFQHAAGAHYAPGWHRAVYAEEAVPDRAADPLAAVLRALGRLTPALPELAGLPQADLPGFGATSLPQAALAWDGLDLAAASCAAGMALHGGLLPVLQCSVSQAEIAQPAIRLARHAGARLVLVSPRTHDAQANPPMPDGVDTLAPGDLAEALDCLILALRHPAAPACLVLPPPSDTVINAASRACSRGGYVVQDAASRAVTLVVAGSALPLAAAVRASLQTRGVEAALVSMPVPALFATQDAAYRAAVLGDGPRVLFGDPARFTGLVRAQDLLISLSQPKGPAGIAEHIGIHLHQMQDRLEAT